MWNTHLRVGKNGFLGGARQLSCVIFSSGCSGEGMKIVGFILEWGLLQTQGETGKEVEGTCEEVLIVRSYSTWSGQGLTLLPTFMYLTSPCHLAPLKTGSSPRNLRNVLSWPHSHPCPASTLSLASPSQPDFSKGLSIPWSPFPCLSSLNPLQTGFRLSHEPVQSHKSHPWLLGH